MVEHLTLAVLVQLAVAFVLTAIAWGVGLGVLSSPRPAEVSRVPAEFAYPIGLALTFVAAGLLLVRPWLGVVSLVVIGWPLGRLVRQPAFALAVWRCARRPLALGVPPAVALAVALGWYYHGPGPTYDSNAGGDIAFYAGRIIAIRYSLFPFSDLAAAGRHYTHGEVGASLLGGAFSYLPRFDPFLFNATALPLAGMLSLLVGFALLPRTATRSARDLFVAVTVATGMVSYVSWFVESVPVTLSAPLAFSIYALYRRRSSLGALVGLTALLAALCLATKVLVLLPLAVLAATPLVRDHRNSLRGRAVWVAVAAIVIAAAAVIATLFVTASWFTNRIGFGFVGFTPFRRLGDATRTEFRPAGDAIFLIGVVLVSAGLVRARRYALAAAIVVPTALAQFVQGLSLAAGTCAAALIIAADVWMKPLRKGFALVATGGVGLCAALAVRDIAPLRSALVFALLLAATVAVGLAATVGSTKLYPKAIARFAPGLVFALAGRGVLAFLAPFSIAFLIPYVPSRSALARTFATVSVALVLLAMLAASAVAVRRDTFGLSPHRMAGLRPVLSRDDWDAWHYVRTRTPPRALIFTSLTGLTVDEHHGWNYYAMLGGRQIYIAGWIENDISVHQDQLVRRLQTNADVLGGRLTPCELGAGWSLGPYYAVLRRSDAVPPHARLVHENPSLAVYRLASCMRSSTTSSY